MSQSLAASATTTEYVPVETTGGEILPFPSPANSSSPGDTGREPEAPPHQSYTTAQALAEFERWSRSYDRSFLQYLLFEPTHRLLLAQLAPDVRRLLDIGCGTGKFLAQVAECFPETEIFGLDLSPGMLERAKPRCQRYGDRVRLVRGDSACLPFPDNFFDVVTCSHSFHHYPDQQRVICEIYRVLRPNGRMLLVDGDRDGWWGWFIYDICVTWLEGGVHHCSAKRFRQLCQSAGFQQLQQIRRGRLAPFLVTVATAIKTALEPAMPLSRAA
jgi:ubiquinone/menaquinone biosynthesis C-methylase UbiE